MDLLCQGGQHIIWTTYAIGFTEAMSCFYSLIFGLQIYHDPKKASQWLRSMWWWLCLKLSMGQNWGEKSTVHWTAPFLDSRAGNTMDFSRFLPFHQPSQQGSLKNRSCGVVSQALTIQYHDDSLYPIIPIISLLYPYYHIISLLVLSISNPCSIPVLWYYFISHHHGYKNFLKSLPVGGGALLPSGKRLHVANWKITMFFMGKSTNYINGHVQ